MSIDKKEFSKRLNEMLNKANLPKKGKGRQASLASLFAVSQESARKWICGESLPDIKRIPHIAAAFKVSPQWLLYGIGYMSPNAQIKKLPTANSPDWKRVPILSWHDAINWKENVKNSLEKSWDEIEWAWAETEIGAYAYALIVRDDSMEPRYMRNSILIIDPEYIPSHKHIVIYLLKNSDEVVCKQLLLDPPYKYLKPHNHEYKTITVKDNDVYCGAIRQARMKY